MPAARPEFDEEPAQRSLFPEVLPTPRVQPAIRLTEGNVARTVPPGCPGVYFLKSVGARGQVAERVGREELDLRQRLMAHAREAGKNTLFGWILAADANDAYRLECTLWHAQGGAWSGIQADAHPIPTERIPFLGCPDCEE